MWPITTKYEPVVVVVVAVIIIIIISSSSSRSTQIYQSVYPVVLRSESTEL